MVTPYFGIFNGLNIGQYNEQIKFFHITVTSAASVTSRLDWLVGLFLQRVGLDLSIKIVKIAEFFQHPINLCHFPASLYLPDPASSPSSS